MKRKISIVALTFLLLFLLSVVTLAKGKDFDLSLDNDYIVSYSTDKDVSKTAKTVGMSEKELRDYFEKNGVLLFAATKDNTSQVKLSQYENDFSKLAYNISALDDEGIDELANSVSNNKNAKYGLLSNKGQRFIKLENSHKDSGGEYTVTQYVTVENGKIYQLSLYNPGTKAADNVDDIFESLDIESEFTLPIWQTMLFILSIAAFATLGAVMIYGIIKTLRQKDEKK